MKTWPGAIAAAILICAGIVGICAGGYYLVVYHYKIVEMAMACLMVIAVVGSVAIEIKLKGEKKNG